MRTKYEIIAQDMLPAVRAMIAKELSDGGYTQQEIAFLLNVSQPAVSQYLRNIRGVKRINEKKAASVKILCDKIKTEEIKIADINKEIYKLCESFLE